MTMQEQHERFREAITVLRERDLESASLVREVKDNCANPLICLVMDIIENDAVIHARIEEVIAQSLEEKAMSFSPEEIGEVIGLIRRHVDLKRQAATLAEETIDGVTDKSLGLQTFLMRGLLADEQKHRDLLEGIEKVRSHLYPYWAH